MFNVSLGLHGLSRDGAAAVTLGSTLVAVCPQERLTRLRRASVSPTLSSDAASGALTIAGRTSRDVQQIATAEPGFDRPDHVAELRFEHHQAHAATAFYTSGFSDAAVLVCDGQPGGEISVWTGRGTELTAAFWPWRGPGFVSMLAAAARIVVDGGNLHELETLARVAPSSNANVGTPVLRYADGSLEGVDQFQQWISASASLLRAPIEQRAAFAAAAQRGVGNALVELVAAIRRATDQRHLCLGGGLFYNTFLNTLVGSSRIFDAVSVPPNPGNAGLAVGNALLAAYAGSGAAPRGQVSPFLGPSYDDMAVKTTLDNCKLSYGYAAGGERLTTTVDALSRGFLVGWFQGPMEWGHRALGNRSILASPLAPFVLDNLNTFLKQRPRHNTYGLVICEEDGPALLEDFVPSRLMEFEFRLRDPERFRHVLPYPDAPLRVQTLPPGAGGLRDVVRRFGDQTGTSALVNTSFNGLHEPIVCSPRDAVRVFYGTGIDTLVIDRFILRK